MCTDDSGTEVLRGIIFLRGKKDRRQVCFWCHYRSVGWLVMVSSQKEKPAWVLSIVPPVFRSYTELYSGFHKGWDPLCSRQGSFILWCLKTKSQKKKSLSFSFSWFLLAAAEMGCGLNKLEKRDDKRPGNIYSTLKRPQVETKIDVSYEYRFLEFTTLSAGECRWPTLLVACELGPSLYLRSPPTPEQGWWGLTRIYWGGGQGGRLWGPGKDGPSKRYSLQKSRFLFGTFHFLKDSN